MKHIIAHLADLYNRTPDMFMEIKPETIIELRNYVEREYKKLPCKVVFVDIDVTCELMDKVYKEQGVLLISSQNNESALFPGELNLKFRAVHDYIHITCEYGCDFNGEYDTFVVQADGLTTQSRAVLFSEIVMQASYFLQYGEFSPVQKIVLIGECDILH